MLPYVTSISIIFCEAIFDIVQSGCLDTCALLLHKMEDKHWWARMLHKPPSVWCTAQEIYTITQVLHIYLSVSGTYTISPSTTYIKPRSMSTWAHTANNCLDFVMWHKRTRN